MFGFCLSKSMPPSVANSVYELYVKVKDYSLQVPQLKPEHCRCLTQISEWSSGNSWVSGLQKKLPTVHWNSSCNAVIFLGVLSVCINSHPSYWRWLSLFCHTFLDVKCKVRTDTKCKNRVCPTSVSWLLLSCYFNFLVKCLFFFFLNGYELFWMYCNKPVFMCV